jgi:isomaltose glucohydrolase
VTSLTTPLSTLRSLAERSVEVIAEHQNVGGAYPASPTFSVYGFSWFRDGAFIADAMSRARRTNSADRFFDWCAGVIVQRQDQIEHLVQRVAAGDPVGRDDHLPTRYTLDGNATGEDWWDFQLDGYGTWMFALAQHLRRHQRSASDCSTNERRAIELCVDYLLAFWREPCFDWWEENVDGIHVSTLASIEAGLRAVAREGLATGQRHADAIRIADEIVAFVSREGVIDGHLIKTIGEGDRVDASLIAALTPFETFDPDGQIASKTYARIVTDLAPNGVHRYLGDTYFGGGRWVVLAGFLGAHEARTGRPDRAIGRLRWMCDQAVGHGLLPEQTTDQSLDPSHIQQWVERWGPVATPLLWSHAMYITLAAELGLLDS